MRLLTPDACTGFQLWDVVGLFVPLISATRRSRGLPWWAGWLRLTKRRLLLLLLGLWALLLMLGVVLRHSASKIGRLSGKVEILAHGTTTKGVVVEGIASLVKLITQAVVALVRLFEVQPAENELIVKAVCVLDLRFTVIILIVSG